MAREISPRADIDAFLAVDRVLTRFEWRDDAGCLVARMLASTLTLGKGRLGSAVEITVPAADFLAVLGWEQVTA